MKNIITRASFATALVLAFSFHGSVARAAELPEGAYLGFVNEPVMGQPAYCQATRAELDIEKVEDRYDLFWIETGRMANSSVFCERFLDARLTPTNKPGIYHVRFTWHPNMTNGRAVFQDNELRITARIDTSFTIFEAVFRFDEEQPQLEYTRTYDPIGQTPYRARGTLHPRM